MQLQILLEEYIFTTVPIYGMNVLIICIQLMLGTLLPAHTIISAIKRENPLQSFILAIVPVTFFTAAAIMEPLLFGAFLGDGYTDDTTLLLFINRPAFYQEMLTVVALFLLSGLFYIRREYLTPVELLLTFGAESIAAATCLIVSLDGLLGHGQVLAALEGTPVKWLVYGIYLLFYKTLLHTVATLWALLFSEKTYDQKLSAERSSISRLTAYLRRSYGPLSIGLLMFLIFFYLFVIRTFFGEPNNRDYIDVFVIIFILVALVIILNLTLLYWLFFPQRSPSFRCFRQRETSAQALDRFCQEYFDQPPLLHSRHFVITPHYMVVHSLFPIIYDLTDLLYRKPGTQPDSIQLCFRDGRKLYLDSFSDPLGRYRRYFAHYPMHSV